MRVFRRGNRYPTPFGTRWCDREGVHYHDGLDMWIVKIRQDSGVISSMSKHKTEEEAQTAYCKFRTE